MVKRTPDLVQTTLSRVLVIAGCLCPLGYDPQSIDQGLTSFNMLPVFESKCQTGTKTPFPPHFKNKTTSVAIRSRIPSTWGVKSVDFLKIIFSPLFSGASFSH
jgi:hypothetical protein